MKNLLIIAVASAALMACQKETIVQGDTPEEVAADAATAANAAEVVLPPSIIASKSYRCKDNSVVYIDWLSDGSARENRQGRPSDTNQGGRGRNAFAQR